MSTRVLFAALLPTLAICGCESELNRPQLEQEELSFRSAGELLDTSVLQAAGSCASDGEANYCGGASGPDGCWCDESCEQYGDCCADRDDVCGGEPREPEHEVEPVAFCTADDDCDAGVCDLSECLPNCEGTVCPMACFGQCVPGCKQASDCSETEYCSFDAGYDDGSVGTCEDRPVLCTRDYKPVCSQSAKTYSNSCDAASKGAAIRHIGACK